jgi:hypothetical protein
MLQTEELVMWSHEQKLERKPRFTDIRVLVVNEDLGL